MFNGTTYIPNYSCSFGTWKLLQVIIFVRDCSKKRKSDKIFADQEHYKILSCLDLSRHTKKSYTFWKGDEIHLFIWQIFCTTVCMYLFTCEFTSIIIIVINTSTAVTSKVSSLICGRSTIHVLESLFTIGIFKRG